MLAAVQPTADYEGLRNYIIGGGRPTDVRSLDGNGVRQPMGLPNGAVPGVQAPIPTSSARPGKMTNQRIVYQRVQTQFARECGDISLVPVVEGDVVFVHRGDGKNTQGHDHARVSRLASIGQLNATLRSYRNIDDPQNLLGAKGDIVMAPANDPNGEDVPDNVDDKPVARWEHCKFLSEWTPDGVLASKEHDCVMDVSNPGEVFNVAVGGPTLVRNAGVGDYPQHIDDGVRTLDKVFVGLVAYEARDDDGKLDHYWYQYKLFTSRQLAWSRLANTELAYNSASGKVPESQMNASAAGGNNGIGPTADEYRSMVQVWRVGSVLDTRAGMAPHKCLTLNVVIEEWSLDHVAVEYNALFGASVTMLKLAQGVVKVEDVFAQALALAEATAIDALGRAVEVLVAVPVVVPAEGTEVTMEEARFGADLNPEVDAWEKLDKQYTMDMELYDLRLAAAVAANVPKEHQPVEPTVPSTKHQHVLQGPRLGDPIVYEPVSARLSTFYEAYNTKVDEATKNLFKPNAAARQRLALLGRAVSLSSGRYAAMWEAKGTLEQRSNVYAVHTHVLALRRAMDLGARIASGTKIESGSWPLS